MDQDESVSVTLLNLPETPLTCFLVSSKQKTEWRGDDQQQEIPEGELFFRKCL